MVRSIYSVLILLLFAGVFPGFVSAAPLKTGNPAPDFALASLEGKTVKLSDYKGQIVVLGLFHICEPCRQQGEILQSVGRKLQDKGVRIIGVNAEGDSREDVQEFVKTFETGMTFPYLVDPSNSVSDLYSVRITPNI